MLTVAPRTTAITGLTIKWVHSVNVGKRLAAWQFTAGFPQACGMHIGTPVRVRGVPVGQVVGVAPRMDSVQVTIEIREAGVVVPRASTVEVNQTGLISETMIDISPQSPIPEYSAGPLDKGCEAEGVLVCHKGHAVGKTGYSLDELVNICTKLAKEMDHLGMERMFDTADTVNMAIRDAQPLLEQAIVLSKEVTPLLKELNDGDIMGNLEKLTSSAAVAVADIARINEHVLTPDNLELLKDSVSTLVKTLKHIEDISDNVSDMVGDNSTQANIKQLIQSLSRILVD